MHTRSSTSRHARSADAGATRADRAGAVQAKPRKTPKIAEKHVLAACLAYLNTLPGVSVWRQNSGAFKGEYQGKQRFVRFGQPGQADITGMIHGVRLEVEVKATGKWPTDMQMEWLQFIYDRGGHAFWCDSVEMCSNAIRMIFEERGLNWKREWEI